MSNYGIALHINGDNLTYFNKAIKFLSSDKSNIEEVQKFVKLVDRNMLQNEPYLVMYYAEYLNKIRPINKLNLNMMINLTEVDKNKIVDLPNIELNSMVDVREEFKGDFIVDLMKSYVSEIDSMEEVDLNEYRHCLELLKELVKSLKCNNVLFVGSRILNGEYRLGRKKLKGKEDFIDYAMKEVRSLRELEEDKDEMVIGLDMDKFLSRVYLTDDLFPHPLKSLKESWGSIFRGQTLGIMAPVSVGKTTLSINYMASALISKVNSALFVSEMNEADYMARLVPIIGALKYKVFIKSDTVKVYLNIKKKKYQNLPVLKSELLFIENNTQQINNIEYIMSHIFSQDSSELGHLSIVTKIELESIVDLYNTLKERDVELLVVDHVNGVVSENPRLSEVQITNEAYVRLHKYAKSSGVATIITNHIPDESISIINDLDADISNVRGSNAGQSTKSLDNVIILCATMEQMALGEFVVRTNKARNSGIFFEPFLVSCRKEIGLLYEEDVDNDEEV